MSVSVKRSISLYGHRTSVALEPVFWEVIDAYATQHNQSLAQLIMQLDDSRIKRSYRGGLASYLRVWVAEQLKAQMAAR